MSSVPALPSHASTLPRPNANEVWAPVGDATILKNTNYQWTSTTLPVSSLNSGKRATSPLTVLFIATAKGPKPGAVDLQARLAADFGVPSWFWSAKVQDASGYFYGNSSNTDVITVFHFLIKYVTVNGSMPEPYGWHTPSFITTWKSSGELILLCFNLPLEVRTSIKNSLETTSSAELQSHPFAIHSLLLDHIVDLHDTSIWKFRDFVRQQEQSRPTLENPKPDYARLHDLARHVMHATEVSETALNVIDGMLEEVSAYNKNHPKRNDILADIRRHRSLLQCINRRSQALEERLRNEINLAFHIATEHDFVIQMQIAYAANVDSSAMKTISILGMLFLPGTFISALFSMSFFNFTPASGDTAARWSMSNKFWIYWVVAIPVTALTIAVWYYWQKNSEPAVPRVSKHDVNTFTAPSESAQSSPLRSRRKHEDKSVVSKV